MLNPNSLHLYHCNSSLHIQHCTKTAASAANSRSAFPSYRNTPEASALRIGFVPNLLHLNSRRQFLCQVLGGQEMVPKPQYVFGMVMDYALLLVLTGVVQLVLLLVSLLYLLSFLGSAVLEPYLYLALRKAQIGGQLLFPADGYVFVAKHELLFEFMPLIVRVNHPIFVPRSSFAYNNEGLYLVVNGNLSVYETTSFVTERGCCFGVYFMQSSTTVQKRRSLQRLRCFSHFVTTRG